MNFFKILVASCFVLERAKKIKFELRRLSYVFRLNVNYLLDTLFHIRYDFETAVIKLCM